VLGDPPGKAEVGEFARARRPFGDDLQIDVVDDGIGRVDGRRAVRDGGSLAGVYCESRK